LSIASLSPTIVQAEQARRDFSLFVKLAWSVIEPGTAFVPGWHLDAISEHLQAVTEGHIKRLLINMPPRHGKSTLISVLWPMWSWITDPSIRWLCGSYAMNLATRDNLKCRRVIKSNWFQERYGHVFMLTKDQDAKTKFENDHMGYRMAVSVGSSATGEGGDVLLLDDPHNIDEKESDARREAALDWFNNTWSTRLNNQQTGAMVVVGQRIHERDVSGHILETNDGEWIHLNLPAEYESASPCKTFLPSGKLFWQDPRIEENELLWPPRFPSSVIEKAKRRHGPLGYAALYQQRPTPATGGTFNRANERLFTQSYDQYFLHTPRGVRAVNKQDCVLFVAVDPAISEKQSADYMVISIWAQTPIKDLLLLDIRRGHWAHNEQQDEVEEAFNDALAEFVGVETVNYQHALFQDLVMRGIPCRPFTPHKDKVARAVPASIWQANGKIYFLKDAPWLPEFQNELYKFPKAAHDDQVDVVSLASIIVRSKGPLSDDDDDMYSEIPDPVEGPAQPGDETVSFTQNWRDPESVAPVISQKPVDAFTWAETHERGWDW
jgi:predicted phage terminase large subunit-like protein